MPVKEIFIDPVTRIEGHLALRVLVDTDTGKVIDAWSIAAMFRGFESILRGRSPETAIFLTCRSCGVCGAAHANASMLACDMALEAIPEPMGVVLRNLAYAMTDYIYDHSTLLANLEGPDYGCVFLRRYQPSIWNLAKETPCEFSSIHGFKRMDDLLRAYNPIIGDPVTGISIWRLNIYFQRFAKEAGSLIYGKYPHPATLIPGGIMTDLTNAESLIQAYIFRLNMVTAWVKYLVATWFDMYYFFEDVADYVQGKTYDPPIMLSAGLFDDPEEYSSLGGTYADIYAEIDRAYEKRICKPGIAFGRELWTTSLTKMQRNMIELVSTGFYADWKDKKPFVTYDPAGVVLVDEAKDVAERALIYHEWNKWTMPLPLPTNYEKGPYSWGYEVRIVRGKTMYPFEAGPLPKVWVMSLQSYESKPLGLIKCGGGRIRIVLPETKFYTLLGKFKLPPETEKEVVFEWSIDKWAKNGSTTLARLLGRAVSLAIACAAAWENVMMALEYIVAGHLKTSRPWRYPVESLGVGWLEAPRGAVRHWIVVRNGRIANYQYHAPTTGNVTPRTKAEKVEELGLKPPTDVKTAFAGNAVRGPYEAALLNTKVTEEVPPDKWIGLDFVRAIRSFDPCLGCTVHIELTGKISKVIKKYLSPASYTH